MTILILTICLILAIIFGWHLIFPLLGGAIVVTGTIWLLIVGFIAAFCIAILMVLFLTGIGVFILGGVLALLTILSIILFPILFPILLPLFILFLFISYWRKRKSVN